MVSYLIAQRWDSPQTQWRRLSEPFSAVKCLSVYEVRVHFVSSKKKIVYMFFTLIFGDDFLLLILANCARDEDVEKN